MTETTTPERDAAFVEVKENPARDAAREMMIKSGGVVLTDWSQQVDYAKYMAASRHAIPKHLRGDVGACIAVIDMAARWGFAPYQVARQCYLVNDMLGFESQIIHAVIEKFAPIKYRLRPTYSGDGDNRKCRITGHFKGEVDPLEYETPALGKINPKNSPLWKSDPDQQLFYFATQRWARRYCPDILFGIHDIDQFETPPIGFDNARDITPRVAGGLADRLREKGDEGFEGEKTLAVIDAAIKEASEPVRAE
jgi:hypothetical protein